MALIYELDLGKLILKMYLNDLSMSRLSQVTALETDKHAHISCDWKYYFAAFANSNNNNNNIIIPALHGMETRSCDENSLCPSVCRSVKCVHCDKTEKKDMFRFLYHTKDPLAWFSEKKNGCWGRPLLPKIFGQPAPVGAKSPILNR